MLYVRFFLASSEEVSAPVEYASIPRKAISLKQRVTDNRMVKDQRPVSPFLKIIFLRTRPSPHLLCLASVFTSPSLPPAPFTSLSLLSTFSRPPPVVFLLKSPAQESISYQTSKKPRLTLPSECLCSSLCVCAVKLNPTFD